MISARRIGLLAIAIAGSLLCCGSGCSVRELATTDRMSRGLAVILPGIEGRSNFNIDLAKGLDQGGVDSGIEIFDWNTPIPAGALINLTAYDRNRDQARRLARRIMNYQDAYPGRPVHLVGHSGGGGMAILTLETLPRDRKVTAVLLLAAAISPDHNLTRALHRTEYGIFNYYSRGDVGYLQIGTSFFGTIDRDYGPAAGAVGFNIPSGGDAREEYRKLHQIAYSQKMARYGHGGGHIGWTARPFVREYLAPLIREQQSGPISEGS